MLLKKAHATNTGTEVSITVTINLISITISAGSMGSLRNSSSSCVLKQQGRGAGRIAL